MADTRLLILSFILGILLLQGVKGQVLHTENFNVILDTTKNVKGTFIPSLRYRNVKKKFWEIENTADISLRIKDNAITLANKLEYSRFGDEDILSGGFFYAEHRNITENRKFVIETYGLLLWQEIRGLRIKYSLGANARYRIIYKKEEGLFAGIGPSYEFERWTYSGTADTTLIPEDAKPISVKKLRANTYISYKRKLTDHIALDISTYFQPALGNPFGNYRLASSSELTYSLSKNLGISVLYQNTYDSKPVVPIDKLFHDLTLGLNISF